MLWASSLIKEFIHLFFYPFMDSSTILNRNIECKEGREGKGPLLKACEYQAACQAHHLPTITGMCQVYSQLLNISDDFK